MLQVDWVQWVQPLDGVPPLLPVEPVVRVVRKSGVDVARQYILSGSALRGVREEVTSAVVNDEIPGLTRVDWFIDVPVGSTEALAHALRSGVVRLEGARGFRVWEEYRGGKVGRTVYLGHAKSLVRVYCGTLLGREAERLERQTRGEFLVQALADVRRGRYNPAISGPIVLSGLPLLDWLWSKNVSGRRS